MVRLKGLEPTRISAREPKSRMSTNSITGANMSGINQPASVRLRDILFPILECGLHVVVDVGLERRPVPAPGRGVRRHRDAQRGQGGRLLYDWGQKMCIRDSSGSVSEQYSIQLHGYRLFPETISLDAYKMLFRIPQELLLSLIHILWPWPVCWEAGCSGTGIRTQGTP